MNDKIMEQSLKIGYLHSCNASPQGRFNYGKNNSDLTAEKPSRQLQSIVKVNITCKRYVKIPDMMHQKGQIITSVVFCQKCRTPT